MGFVTARGSMTAGRLLFCTIAISTALTAQRHADPHELMQLQPVLHRAIEQVEASIVRVETFGGTRRALIGQDGPGDAAAAPKPKPKPREEPEQKPADEEDKPAAPKTAMPGFLQAQGATTGVILSEDGWILVSRFGLNFDPNTILITLSDGRLFHATRAGEDTSRGIALVKIDAKGLPVPEFVKQADVRVGQWAFALGRTFGEDEPSVHMGIVSATRRIFGRAVQVDAYTSPANYGGPIIDVRGRILGISVPMSPSGRDAGVDWYDSGIGFGVAIDEIGSLLDRLKAGEVLHRGYLGIRFDSSDIGPGVKLADVTDAGPARNIGLKKGDRITKLDGKTVRNSFHMQMLVSSKMGGDPLVLEWTTGDGADRKVQHGTVDLANVPQRERVSQTKKDEAFSPPWYDDEEPDPAQDRK